MARLKGHPAGATRATKPMSDLHGYCFFDTALGTCAIAWSARGVTRLQLPERDVLATERRLRTAGAALQAPPPPVERAIGAVQTCLRGERVDLGFVAVDLGRIDGLRTRIYAAARAI